MKKELSCLKLYLQVLDLPSVLVASVLFSGLLGHPCYIEGQARCVQNSLYPFEMPMTGKPGEAGHCSEATM